MDFIRNNWEIPLFILFAGLSIAFADVDLWLSAQFWHEQDGFTLNDQAWVQFVYVVFRYMPVPWRWRLRGLLSHLPAPASILLFCCWCY